MAKSEPTKQRGWLNKNEMAASLGISVQAFDKWGVVPVARIGREAFFTAQSVVENRVSAQDQKKQLGFTEDSIDPLAEAKLTQERLRLTSAQAEAQELKNQVTRRRLIPVEAFTFILAKVAPAISSTCDTLPLVLRRRHPDVQTRFIDTAEREMTKIRNTCAQLADRAPEWIDEFLDSIDQ
jgi:phage terminase Nu1 subunit (DNA packaging protein)